MADKKKKSANPKTTTKKEAKMPMKGAPKKMDKCTVVTSPATLSIRDIIGAVLELAPKVKSAKICDYLRSKGFVVTESSVRAYKANITRIGA